MNDSILKMLESFAKAAGFSNKHTIPEIIGSIIGTVLSFLGVIFLCLIIYGGFVWMTAVGNESKIVRAKQIIVNAIIGLTIVLSSYAISYFVIKALTDATT